MNPFKLNTIGIVIIFFLLGGSLVTEASNNPQTVAPKQNQRVDGLLKLTHHFQDEFQIRKELRFFEEILANEPDNENLLQKAAFLHYRLGWLYSNKEEQKDHFFSFYDYASRAHQINSNNYHTELLLAGAKAKIARYLSNGDQVRIVRELVSDIDTLLKRKKDDPEALYILSWLNFKVGRIPTIKKFLARVLFGGLPEELSTERAFSSMKSAIQFRPNYIVYHYDLGLYHLRTGNKDQALLQFKVVLSMQPISAEGAIYQQRASNKIKETGTLTGANLPSKSHGS